jgi:hypothetical protein
MTGPRFALRLLAYGDAFGVREELVGDVIEEIARGRSRFWVWQQLAGLFGSAVLARVRDRAGLTPYTVALVLALVLLAAVSIVPATRVLQAWLGVYYSAGALSLFAHMASHTVRGG